MRAPITVVILGTALLALWVFPAEARGGGARSGHFARAMPRHSFIGPRHFNRFGFNRFAFNRFGFAEGGQFAPFGFFDGFGDFGAYDVPFDYGSVAAADAPPTIVAIAPQPAQPPRAQTAAQLPPCHETTPSGVTIDRGMGCSRAPP